MVTCIPSTTVIFANQYFLNTTIIHVALKFNVNTQTAAETFVEDKAKAEDTMSNLRIRNFNNPLSVEESKFFNFTRAGIYT